MSVDVNRCDRILLPFSNISVSPILVSIAIWQIYVRMGNAIWGALGTTVFFLLMNIGQERVQEQVSTDQSVDQSMVRDLNILLALRPILVHGSLFGGRR